MGGQLYCWRKTSENTGEKETNWRAICWVLFKSRLSRGNLLVRLTLYVKTIANSLITRSIEPEERIPAKLQKQSGPLLWLDLS